MFYSDSQVQKYLVVGETKVFTEDLVAKSEGLKDYIVVEEYKGQDLSLVLGVVVRYKDGKIKGTLAPVNGQWVGININEYPRPDSSKGYRPIPHVVGDEGPYGAEEYVFTVEGSGPYPHVLDFGTYVDLVRSHYDPMHDGYVEGYQEESNPMDSNFTLDEGDDGGFLYK